MLSSKYVWREDVISFSAIKIVVLENCLAARAAVAFLLPVGLYVHEGGYDVDN